MCINFNIIDKINIVIFFFLKVIMNLLSYLHCLHVKVDLAILSICGSGTMSENLNLNYIFILILKY